MSKARQLVEEAVQDEIHDLAADFVEQEVGRLDWVKNLALLKSNGQLQPRLEDWLKRMGYGHELAAPIVEEVERLLKLPGRWR